MSIIHSVIRGKHSHLLLGVLATIWCTGCASGDADSEALGYSRAELTFDAITRENFSNAGVQANEDSFSAAISADGRFVSWESASSNLVAGDTNGVSDILTHDRQTGQVSLESRSSAGVLGNGQSRLASLSSDGRFVVFESVASNLVAGDTNGVSDIFVRDRVLAQTTRVSVSGTGAQSNGQSMHATISGDGRFVAFSSSGTNLVAGDTNGLPDIFLRDRNSGQTTRVSVSSSGAQANGFSVLPHISADGSFVSFESDATNLVTGDTNGTLDVFVRGRLTGQTVRASVSSAGAQADSFSEEGNLSADGRFVTFFSSATNLVPGDTNGFIDIFVRDLLGNLTTRESVSSSGAQGDGQSLPSIINSDGRFIAFVSSATNLVSGDTNGVQDVFARDRVTGQTIRISIGNDGSQGNAASSGFTLGMTANGRRVAFNSAASNLVAADSNGKIDIFASSLSP